MKTTCMGMYFEDKISYIFTFYPATKIKQKQAYNLES